jgi:hypothetical protein
MNVEDVLEFLQINKTECREREKKHESDNFDRYVKNKN